VGCDGAHSLVRYQLGVAFEGEAFEQRFAVADVRVAWPLPGDEVFAFLNRGNFMAFFPMAGGLHRVAIAYPAAAEPDGSVSVAELQESLDRNGPTGARITDVAWTSRFRINQRKASRQSAGRLFLTGDAAHVHSLVGAQGMNTGIQDAINLAWKPAMHIQRVAPRALLDTYETERGSVARRLVHGTRRFTRLTLLRAPVATAARRRIAPLVLSRPAVQQRIALAISQTDVSYRESPLRAGPAAKHAPAPGDRAPDANLTTGPHGSPIRLYELLRDIRHVLLFFTGDGDDNAADRLWRALDAHLHAFRPLIVAHRIVPAARSAARRSDGHPDGDLYDAGAAVHERYGLPHGGAVVLRPDGYVAVRAELSNLSPLQNYLQQWFTPSQHHRSTPARRRRAGSAQPRRRVRETLDPDPPNPTKDPDR